MVREYASELRRVQPSGPYQLCGFCFGGLVAFALASELVAQGEEVRFLGLLDAFGSDLLQVGYSWKTFSWLGERLWEKLTAFDYDPRLWPKRLRMEWEMQRGRLADRIQLRKLTRSEAHLPLGAAPIQHYLQFAVHNYRARFYPGSAVVFRSTNQGPLASRRRDFFWGRLVQKVMVIEVPGEHDSMLQDPNVGALAKAMSAFLSPSLASGVDPEEVLERQSTMPSSR